MNFSENVILENNDLYFSENVILENNDLYFSENAILEDNDLYFTDQEMLVVRHGSNPYLMFFLFLCYFVLYFTGHEIIL